MKGRLRTVPDCKKCTGDIIPLGGLPTESVVVSNEYLEVVKKFCYLGDMISPAGGVDETIVARIRNGYKKFRELLPQLTSKLFSLHTKGNIFQSCIRIVVLYCSEVCAVKEEGLAKLERNDMMMVLWVCNERMYKKLHTKEV